MTITISNRKIGPDHPPFVIAEMSGNHNHSLERALRIAEAAADAGAHALKLQTYTPDTMTIDLAEREFFISDPNNPWAGHSLFQLYQKAYTPWEWHEPIMRRCRELGILCFSTPFDVSAVDFLETLDVPFYKIASFENTDLTLVRRVAATGKPMIISSGMATVADLDETVRAARAVGCRDLILLKCTSAYPSSPDESHVVTIPHMRKLFGCQVGLSDHTFGIGVAIASVALGATVIEKHFTLKRMDGGVDSSFSMEPHELRALVNESERAWRALGNVMYGPLEKEKTSMVFRRSLYIVEDMKKGDIITSKNLRAIRPGYGLPPKYYDSFLGRRVNCDVKKGTPLRFDLVG